MCQCWLNHHGSWSFNVIFIWNAMLYNFCIILYIGLRRVTLIKDPQKGIGCTIKNAADHIVVYRILEDGPIAETGILRPDKK